MAEKQLYIDLWDGDTLLHIGTACLDLKMGLRQGNLGVTVDEEVEIIWDQYSDEATQKSTTTHSGSNKRPIALNVGPRSMKIGTLHINITNIARSKNNENYSSAPEFKEVAVVYDYHENSNLRLNTTHDAKKLVEVDAELHEIMMSATNERIARRKLDSQEENGEVDVSNDIRKLQKVYKLLQKDNMDVPIDPKVENLPSSDVFTYKESRNERERDQKTVEIFRERRKRNTIQEALRAQITTKHVINASFGQGHFFEFLIQNPYSSDHNFTFSWSENRLRLVTDEKEWRYHRNRNDIMYGIEANMVKVMPDGSCQLFLHANEKVSIPFIYQSMIDENPNSLTSPNQNIMINDNAEMSPRIINVLISSFTLDYLSQL